MAARFLAVNSTITVCRMLAWCTIRGGGRLDTSMEDDQAGAHGSRPPEQPAHLDLLDDDREAQPVIERVGDPAVPFRDVTKVSSSMVVGDRAPVSRMLELAHQLEGLARLDKPVDVAPAVHPSRRRTSEFVDATGVGGYARLFEQRERIA